MGWPFCLECSSSFCPPGDLPHHSGPSTGSILYEITPDALTPSQRFFFLYLPALPAQALPPLYCPDLSGCYVHLGPSLCPHQTKNSSRVGFSRITQPRRMHYKCFLNLCWDYFCLCVSVFAWACPSAWTAVPVSVHTACFETCHQVLLPLAPAPVYPSPNAHSSCPCTSLHHGLVAV